MLGVPKPIPPIPPISPRQGKAELFEFFRATGSRGCSPAALGRPRPREVQTAKRMIAHAPQSLSVRPTARSHLAQNPPQLEAPSKKRSRLRSPGARLQSGHADGLRQRPCACWIESSDGASRALRLAAFGKWNHKVVNPCTLRAKPKLKSSRIMLCPCGNSHFWCFWVSGKWATV